MKEIRISDEEVQELVLIMQIALSDVDFAISQSHDMGEVQAYQEHKKLLRKWLKYFQKMASSSS